MGFIPNSFLLKFFLSLSLSLSLSLFFFTKKKEKEKKKVQAKTINSCKEFKKVL